MNEQALAALSAERAGADGDDKPPGEPISFKVLVALPRFTFGLLSQMLITMSL